MTHRICLAHALPAAVLAAGLLGLAAGPAARPTHAAPARQECAGNLLANPAFDGGSHKTESEGTSLSSAVGDGWHPWFVRGDETNNREPEFKVEQVAIGGDPARVRSGGQSMKWFTTWATHTAGVYQRVNVAPGTRLQLTGHGMAYSGEADIFDGERKTFLSDPERPGNYRMSVGIDPTGALPAGMGSPPPPTVVWSGESMATDQWVPLTVSAVAQAPAVTVYLKGQPDWSVKHNDSFWDDICLTAGGRGAVSAPVATVDPNAPAEPTAAAGPVEPTVVAEGAAPTTVAEAPAVATRETIGSRARAAEATAMPARSGRAGRAPAPPLLPPVPGKAWAIRL